MSIQRQEMERIWRERPCRWPCHICRWFWFHEERSAGLAALWHWIATEDQRWGYLIALRGRLTRGRTLGEQMVYRYQRDRG